MAKTIVGLFDDYDEAQDVVQELVDDGFARDDISIVANDAERKYASGTASGKESQTDTDTTSGAAKGAGAGAVVGGLGGLLVGLGVLAIPGIGPVLAAGPIVAALGGAGIGAVAGGLIGALTDLGVPEEEAKYYAEGVRRGGTLVTVKTSDDMAGRASDIMNDHDAVDVNERSANWQERGWTGHDANADSLAADELINERDHARNFSRNAGTSRLDASEATVPIIEEELMVGKRDVNRGGVQVYSYITETPVEENVQLREEYINVERRPVDRPASTADFNAFQEGTLEISETSEEAVIGKRARVVEEVVVGKETQQRTKTIRDKVRRTNVDLEQTGAEQTTTGATNDRYTFDTYDDDFRSHYRDTVVGNGDDYEQYRPAYEYGYTLASDQRYSGDWENIEPQVERDWQRRDAGPWERVKDAVHYSWDRARNRH